MYEKTKTVFYCDFCARHRLSRHAIEQHERTCTLNPDRDCRWSFNGKEHPDFDLGAAVAHLRERVEGGSRTPFTSADIDWLHDECEGCPPCMLAALRQSGAVDYHYDDRSQRIFDYENEVTEYRKAERDDSELRESLGY